MEQETQTKQTYEREGQVQGAVGAIIFLIVGIGVATLVLIFVGALGGQTWNLVEDDIDAISNNTTRDAIKNSVISGFQALEQTGKFLPIIVLAVVITLVLTLILGFLTFGNMGGESRGMAL